MSNRLFTPLEWLVALAGALVVQVLFIGLLALAGDSQKKTSAPPVEQPLEIPIEVQPVLDDLPLLKLGSKQDVKPALPEMWQKRAPVPVKRFEERSAPSEQAKDDVEDIPDSELADEKHKAPPEDAEIVKKVDQDLEDESDEPPPPSSEEGAADGVEEGTETDPLKARQVDLYRRRIAGWFNAKFTQPTGIPCDVLKSLSASVAVQVGAGRRVTSFSLVRPSGNATFDRRVSSTMQALTGQQLPPPPAMYPDILGSTLSTRLLGQSAGCVDSAAPSTASQGESGTSEDAAE